MNAFRSLGTTGLQVSRIGLGTVKFGRNTAVKYPTAFDLPDDSALQTLIGVARDCNINLIDTAPAYGTSETRLGKLLRGQRHEWIIATKVGEYFEDNTSTFDFSPDATRASVEASLRRLNTDFLDIVLVHSDGNDEAIIRHSGALETLSRLKSVGTIRAFGISTKTLAGARLALDLCDVIMVAYSAADTSHAEILELAAARQKGVLVKKALDSGHVTDPLASLRFVLGHHAVSSAIVGTINPDHLRANAAAVNE